MNPHRHFHLIAAAAPWLLASAVHAVPKTWRVDNVPGHPGDFTSVNAAIASPEVQEGDTLVLQGDFTSATTSLTRKLHLVGYGFFHAQNGYNFPAGTPLEARLGAVIIEPGAATRADGASITGCVMGGVTVNDAANVLLRRNKLTHILLAGTGSQGARGITIAQNYFLGQGANYSSTISFSGSHAVGDVLVAGNYISTSGNQFNPGSSLASGADDAVTVVNNVLYSSSVGGYGAFQNNIIQAGFSFSTWVTVSNNMAVGGTFLPVGSGNINGETVVNVFENTISPDGKWKLKTGSPAIGTGADGYDMGMYSGPLPYILSGLPPVPMITQLQVPPVVQDGQDVTVTLRAETKP
jgi:hypothetical protein